MFNQVHDNYIPFSRAKCVEYPIIPDPQLEQPLPLTSQRFRCNNLEVFSQPTEFFENLLGDRLTQTSQVIFSFGGKFYLVHFTTLTLV